MYINTIAKLFSFTLVLVSTVAMANPASSSVLNIQHWQTPKGTPVYFVQTKELPMVDIVIAFDAGSSHDGKLPGLANLTASLLDEGTKQLTADQIAHAFDSQGAQFGSATNRDMTLVSLRSLTKANLLNPSLDLFSKLLYQASFPTRAFNRVKRNTLAGILEDKQQPMTVANKALLKALYPNYPYGHPVSGSERSVKTIDINAVKQFYRRYYTAKNAVIAIVGAIDRKQAEAIATKITASLRTGQKAKPLGMPQEITTRRIDINYPSTQTYIRFGTLGISRDDPDYFPMLVGNYILGGGIVSRMFDVIREQHGLAYGAYSTVLPLAKPGPFLIALQTKTKTTDQAIKLAQSVLTDYLKTGPTEKELIAAKKFLTGSFPLKIASNSDIADYVTVIGFYGLPLNFLDTYRAKIEAVTAAQIRAALNRHIQPTRMVVVTVGKQTSGSQKAKQNQSQITVSHGQAH